MRSKYMIRMGILLVVLVTAIFLSGILMTQEPKLEGDMFVHQFDSQNADMKIVNGEKEYFAVKVQRGKYDSYFNVYDRALNPLLETELSLAGEKAGRFLPLGNHKDQWYLLDVESLKLTETDLIEPVVHESSEYMAGIRKEKGQETWAVERTKNGEILWEGTQPIELTSQPWHVIARGNKAANIPDRIINLKTGEAEYTAGEGETIREGGLGFWEVDCELVWDYVGTEKYFTYTYLLDKDYEPAFGGKLFGDVYLDGDFLCGTLREDDYLSDVEELKYEAVVVGTYSPVQFIWTAEGEKVFESRPGSPEKILGIRGDQVLYENERGDYFSWHLSGSEITRRKNLGDDFTYLDFEDGYMRFCRQVGTSYHRLTLQEVPEDFHSYMSIRPEDYRWGYMNTEGDVAAAADYLYASESEGGFGIIENKEGELAIVDLKRQ